MVNLPGEKSINLTASSRGLAGKKWQCMIGAFALPEGMISIGERRKPVAMFSQSKKPIWQLGGDKFVMRAVAKGRKSDVPEELSGSTPEFPGSLLARLAKSNNRVLDHTPKNCPKKIRLMLGKRSGQNLVKATKTKVQLLLE
jgi:hypothetical protein